MSVKGKKRYKKCLAINEVSILRQSRQAANLSIKNNSKYLIIFTKQYLIQLMMDAIKVNIYEDYYQIQLLNFAHLF